MQGGIPEPVDRWSSSDAAGLDILDGLVYRSHLLGADRSLANRGGGNTSAKEVVHDHAGRETRVLWVKGSGTDLASITAAGFPGLRLDELLPLRERGEMDDAAMVQYLLQSALRPDQPRASIETLLHAFISATHVDHTHPDAVIALTSSPHGREIAAETFGEEAVWLDYRRPGFGMSKKIAELLEYNPTARAVLLEKHGLVTWGETGEESYQSTIDFVARAARAIGGTAPAESAVAASAVRGEEAEASFLVEAEAEGLPSSLVLALPALRGALLSDTDGVILELDQSPEAIAFASSPRMREVSQTGAPCPDHLINTKHRPLAVDWNPETDDGEALSQTLRKGVASYAEWYRAYYARNVDDETRPFPIDPAGPRVVLIPGIGIATSGTDADRARFSRDLYRRAIAVESAADAIGGFHSLSESEAFAIEYWPLERYKLSQAPPSGELAGKVAVVTGGASGIGRAAAQALASRGAHVVVADRNLDGARELAEELVATHGLRRALAVRVDVTDEGAVVEMTRRAVLEYGGLDILVASAGLASSAPITGTSAEDWDRNYAVLARGYFLAAREAFRVLIQQAAGGSVVFVASKNALVAGANAAAYSSAKAASLHLARCLAEEGGPHGIRVNTVNPDAVIQGSSIWSSDWKAERASTYGISEDELQTFYKGRTKLGVAVLPEDVAEAIAFFAGPRSAKSTGNILNVDGGVTAAYTR